MKNQGVRKAFPTVSALQTRAAADQLYRLAGDVRRIGTRRGATPLDLLIEKEAAADDLLRLARLLEHAA